MELSSSIATNGMVFKHFFEQFDLMMVHDFSLQVERGLDNARIFRTYYQLEKHTKYPVMLFNRSPLKRSTEFGQVGMHHNILGKKDERFDWEEFYGIWGNIDYKFLMIFKDQRQAEQFEVAFAADRHIRDLKKFTAIYDMGLDTELGPFRYELLWDDLNAYEYGQTEMGYISISGSFKCKGEHVVLLERRRKGIKYVIVTGYTWQKQQLFRFTIDLTKGTGDGQSILQ